MWEAFDNSIARLPIRRINFDDKADRMLHDQIVKLVEGLEDAARRLHEAPALADQTLASRRLEGLQDELDELVLDLYGITNAADRSDIKRLGAPL
jgi:hypothetical protein